MDHSFNKYTICHFYSLCRCNYHSMDIYLVKILQIIHTVCLAIRAVPHIAKTAGTFTEGIKRLLIRTFTI